MSEFTPGPWLIDQRDGGSIIGNDPNRPGRQFLICRIGPSHRSRADEQMCSANARLIRAAPEMLEALKGVVAVTDCWTEEFETARTVIARATGQ